MGARQGAQATRRATQDAIAAERSAEQERRREETRAAIRALATEWRTNARFLRHDLDAIARLEAPLERRAADLALPIMHVLPDDVRGAVEAERERVIRFNARVTMRVDRLRRNVTLGELDRETTALGRHLVDSLDAPADRLDAAADDLR